MDISDRMKAIIECARQGDFLVDVGTDHAYIPIMLYKNGFIKKAAACDISKGSVEKARKNVERYGCAEFIDVRQGDGLQTVKEEENPDQIVIAGMGGMLTVDILTKSKNVVNKAERLILQPQRDIDKVRKAVHSLGFRIIDEKMLFEDGKYYNIIVCEKGMDEFYSENDYLFGKVLIENKNQCLKAYIEYELHKLERIVLSIEEKMAEGRGDEQIIKRFQELKIKADTYCEVILCL